MADPLSEKDATQDIVDDQGNSDEEDDEEVHDESHDPVDPLADASTSAAPPPAETSFGGGSLLSSDFHYGSYMASLAPKLKSILNNIKPKSNPTTRLMALQELSEVLSMSTEDTLSGYFSTDAYVRELVHILGGPRKGEGDEEEEKEEETAQDEDADLAAAIALSGGGMLGQDNLEEQLLACRCLANLMEALPGSAYTLVHRGAVPVLCSKLLEIQFIDLAEQTISVSHVLPSMFVTDVRHRPLRSFQKNTQARSSEKVVSQPSLTTSTSSPPTSSAPPSKLPRIVVATWDPKTSA